MSTKENLGVQLNGIINWKITNKLITLTVK